MWANHLYEKHKGLPQQAKVAQGVPGSLRSRIFLTFWHYKGGRSSAICTGRLYPRRYPWYSFSEAESYSGHMGLSGVPRKKSPVTPPGIDPGTVRLVAQCLNHYTTPGPKSFIYNKKKQRAENWTLWYTMLDKFPVWIVYSISFILYYNSLISLHEVRFN